MAFVFDFGGVLFRWRPAELLEAVLPDRASDDAAAAHWVGQIFQGYRGDWGEFDRGTLGPAALAERIAARTGLSIDEVGAVIAAVPGELQPVAESVALLARLRQPGTPMFFLSNMPAPYADDLERRHDFVRRFDDGVFSCRVRLCKPEPEIFALAARRFGLPPAELVFLDDHAPNVAAARAAGWQALTFVDANDCERELRRCGLWPA